MVNKHVKDRDFEDLNYLCSTLGELYNRSISEGMNKKIKELIDYIMIFLAVEKLEYKTDNPDEPYKIDMTRKEMLDLLDIGD